MAEREPLGAKNMPKDFLTPWVLLVLKQWSLHGYLIMQQLNRMGFQGVDHPTLYRELRRLEQQGHVASEWQTDGSGPAKRVYSITEAGEEILKGWTDVVSGYQRMISGFFDLYSQAFGLTSPAGQEPSPSGFEGQAYEPTSGPPETAPRPKGNVSASQEGFHHG